MSRIVPFATVVAVATIVMLTGGCGDAGSSTSSASRSSTARTTSGAAVQDIRPVDTVIKPATGVRLTNAQWILRGDAICQRLFTQLDTTIVKRNSEFARVLPQAAAYELAAFKELLQIVPPAGMVQVWQEMLTSAHAWAENSAKLGEVAQSGWLNLRSPLALAVSGDHEHFVRVAGGAGFRQCSKA